MVCLVLFLLALADLLLCQYTSCAAHQPYMRYASARAVCEFCGTIKEERVRDLN